MACLGHEFCACLAAFRGQSGGGGATILVGRLIRTLVPDGLVWRHTIKFGQRGEGRFEGAAEAAERGRLFLRGLIIERDDLPCAAGGWA